MEAKRTLSVFVDESGRFQHPDPDSRFYIIGMVFHDQSDDIARQTKDFNRSICDLGLDPEAFVFHAGPLIRREKGYEFLSRHHRGKIYNRMMTFARRINFKWHCLCVDKKYLNSSLQIVSKLHTLTPIFYGIHVYVLTSRPVVRVINSDGLKKGFANAAPVASRINSHG